MDNADAKHMLLDIRRRLFGHYPFKDDDDIDLRYALVFGLIIGLTTEAILAVQQDRKPTFVTEASPEAVRSMAKLRPPP